MMSISSKLENEISSSFQQMQGLHNFYNGKTILITGSTGFLGTIIIEKLIRSFPEIRQIIIIIRGKRGKTSGQRMENYFDHEVFARVKAENPSSLSKVMYLEGDVSMENCGLQSKEIKLIHEEVDLVIHSAATISFIETLRVSVNTNVCGTLNILKLCKGIKNLLSFVYVSTMYCNSQNITTEEKIYPHPIKPEKLIDLLDALDDDSLEKISPILIGSWANNYTYSKNAAENLVYSYRHEMPVVIFRPSILTAPYKEPLPGWINKYMGPYSWITYTGLGLSRVMYVTNPDSNSNIVPCDYVAHALIAVIWDMGIQRKKSGVSIINYSSEGNPLSWNNLNKKLLENYKRAPFANSVWIPISIMEPSYFLYKVYNIFLQHIPAYLGDFLMLLGNKKLKFVKLNKKISDTLRITWPFLHHFNFITKNIYTIWEKLSEEDKRELNFNMELINWDEYCRSALLGIKEYLLRDPMSPEALKKAKVKFFWLYCLDKIIKMGLLSLIVYLFKYVY